MFDPRRFSSATRRLTRAWGFGLALMITVLGAGAPSWARTGAGPDFPEGFDPLLERKLVAREALAAERFEDAQRALDEAAGFVPDDFDSEMLELRARALVGLEHWEESLEVLERLTALNRGRGASVRLLEARALRGLDRWREAQALLVQTLESYPRCGPVRAELVDLLVAQDQRERAGRELDVLLQQTPELVWGIALRARLAAGEGQTQAAVEDLRRSLDRDDAGQTLRAVLVELLIESNRGREAWLESQPLLEVAAGPERLELAARAARAAGEPLDAFRALVLALQMDPGRESTLEALIGVLERADELRDDIALERARAHPEDPRGWERVLRGRLRSDSLDDAVALFYQLPADVREDPELRLAGAEALRRTGRLEEAFGLVTGLCCEPPEAEEHGPRAWYERAQVEFAMANYESAERSFDKASIGTWRPEALYNRGLLLREANRAAEAARCFEGAVAERPELAEAWLALGDLRRSALGDRSGAVDAYRRYLELVGADPRVRAVVEELER